MGITYLTVSVVRLDGFREHSTATMVLTNSGSLGPRSPILLSGVRVGEITNVENIQDGVAVEMRLDRRFQVPLSSSVIIENLSALGEPYVLFTPTSAEGPYVEDGQRIDTQAIQMPLSIPDVAGVVTAFLDQLDPETIASLIDSLHQAMSGIEDVMPSLERSTRLLAATLLDRTPELQMMLTNLQTIGGDMEWLGPSMESAGPLWADFGFKVEIVVEALAKFVRLPNVPEAYIEGNGLVAFLPKLTEKLDEIGPDLQQLAPIIAPLANDLGAAPPMDLSRLISQSLGSTSADGSIRLNIEVE
ncbi:MlaD family protein [Hoyosella subflava]|uniref:MlaD family protein n=1 Tax=Hoyosella subflava TaxID=639313 RepID=UPI0013053942|nr:MlaD family protein [Hoyosella subflava]